jgi:uncharacterized membrane protein YeaQ/YmgE (transglycosylase-associated protein family)
MRISIADYLFHSIVFIAFGLIAGAGIHAFDHHYQPQDVLWTTGFGVIGAIIGGFISIQIFGVNIVGFSIESIAVAALSGFVLAAFSLFRFRVRKFRTYQTTEKIGEVTGV